MDDDQQFCLRWNNHQSTLISVFDTLLENETLVDCTLAAEGKFLKAHKVVLSACSPYFATLLQEQYDKHPIFILKDVKYQELRAMMDYMYRGEVNISQDQLAALLKAAESLQIKGLSDNRTGGGAAPKPESSGHHRGGKLSGAYTLEQTKRARLATSGAMDTSGDVSGSREGSSSPSRRRRKVRRRSMENDAHDNSNSSVLQAASNQSILQTGAGMAVSALVSTQLSSGPPAGTSSHVTSTQQQQPLTSTNVTKKTESAKLTSSTAAPASGAAASAAAVQQAQLQQTQTTSDAINTENVQAQSQGGAQGVQGDEEDMDEGSAVGGASAASGPNPTSASASAVHAGVVVKQLASVVDKSSSNHKQKIKDNSVSSVGSEMVIEPKAEYDDDAHDENVEDLTLDEEDMTMEELDQTAGTSQGGEGSSQTYATWQHDRSQDELGLMAQDAQQRDPQEFGRLSPTRRNYSHLGIKTSPYTSPIGTPVIKFEPGSGMEDHNEHESGRATPTTHCPGILLVPKSQPRHGNGDNDDSNDEDSMEPCDLRMDLAKALLAAAQGGGPATLPIGPHHHHAHHPHGGRTLTQLIYPAVPVQVPRPDTPMRRYSSSSGPGQDPASSAAAVMVAVAAAGLAANNTSASSAGGVGGASTSAAAAAAAAAAVAAGGSAVGNWSSSAGSGGAGGGSGGGGSGGGGGGAYACDRCGNTYARPHSLNRHVRFECGVEPKFECPICHKKSKHKHNLVLHMRTHQHR
ncbi:longitudinals lacking protein, isoforms H/M/V isoform X5 [Drosophila rhopaloa]|uniref:Longitudinals lacking protein, isoforms H/M/V isoform X5 n=1 Tax=Drosophila rhopaloa TaxID=1041015 RepID=A0A6P4FAE4_DRORH|nr:longitudinals lacking protein, isoforms H/M/V isoform X5 [Drosophila rhopaloa]